MRDFGDSDDRTKITRINVKKSKAYGLKHDNWATKGGAVANSIQHEVLHAKHPTMTEKDVRRKTPLLLSRMTRKGRNKLYKLVEK